MGRRSCCTGTAVSVIFFADMLHSQKTLRGGRRGEQIMEPCGHRLRPIIGASTIDPWIEFVNHNIVDHIQTGEGERDFSLM